MTIYIASTKSTASFKCLCIMFLICIGVFNASGQASSTMSSDATKLKHTPKPTPKQLAKDKRRALPLKADILVNPCAIAADMPHLGAQITFFPAKVAQADPNCLGTLLDTLVNLQLRTPKNIDPLGQLSTIGCQSKGTAAEFMIEKTLDLYYGNPSLLLKYCYKNKTNPNNCLSGFLLKALTLEISSEDLPQVRYQELLTDINILKRKKSISLLEHSYAKSLLTQALPKSTARVKIAAN